MERMENEKGGRRAEGYMKRLGVSQLTVELRVKGSAVLSGGKRGVKLSKNRRTI